MQRCAASLKEAIGRMRQTVAAIWYPVKDQRALRRFYQDLAGTGATATSPSGSTACTPVGEIITAATFAAYAEGVEVED